MKISLSYFNTVIMETKWHHHWTQKLHGSIITGLQKVTSFSVAKARYLLVIIPILSLSIFSLGYFTNFMLETDKITLWTPSKSDVLKHGKWIKEESGFPIGTYPIHLILHAHGENVLTMDGVDMLFKALGVFEGTDGYDSVCFSRHGSKANWTNAFSYSTKNCDIKGVTNFFNDDHGAYRDMVGSDDDLIQAIHGPRLPNGQLVKDVFGYPQEMEIPEESKVLIVEAELLKLRVGLPIEEAGGSFEKLVISGLLDFRQDLQSNDSNVFQIEVLSAQSYANETVRAIEKDIALLPIIVGIMCAFSCWVYFKRDRVQSSCLCLGIGAVASVILSLITSYGILFLVGIPFSTLTAAVPFVVLGIGLDDAFIITGAFERTDPTMSIGERMKQTINDCGMSIVLTTATTTAALLLGIITNVPAMRAFYIYAAPCVIIDFLYQITFFVALIVIDQQRKHSGRHDCFPCILSPTSNTVHRAQNPGACAWILTRFCGALERSSTLKILICVVFCSWAVVSSLYCSKLKVSFDITDLLPSDSYVRSFIAALEEHADLEAYKCTAFFRDVDFSSLSVQNGIDKYISELVQITNQPVEHFWLHDFQQFINQGNKSIESLPFEDQLDIFLEHDTFQKLYSSKIVRDTGEKGGEMTASAVVLSLSHIAINDASQHTYFLRQQRKISLKNAEAMEKQRGNMSSSDQRDSTRLPFFTFSEDYYLWAFFSVAVDELLLTTILSIATVSIITLLFVPNLYACLVVTLSIAMIYVDVLGIIYFAGLTINPVTLVSIIMSIGLLVDYVLHIVLKCFEPIESIDDDDEGTVNMASKKYKGVRECLGTMGSSVLIGGMSTVLSTIPLMFSTSALFTSICIIFFSFVTVSLLHGVVFVPALLILFLPSDRDDAGDDENHTTYTGEGPVENNQHDHKINRDRHDTVETWDSAG